MAEYNPGFAFYKSFYEAIEYLPLEQQMEICYAIVKYGITGEIVDPKEMPFGYNNVMSNKWSIEDSVERWLLNQNKANYKMDQNVARDYAIAQLIAEGHKSGEIAAIISEKYGEISDSAVRKTAPWKERKNPDFNVKWLGKNCESVHKNCENDVNEERENFEKNVNLERENSQNFVIDSRF